MNRFGKGLIWIKEGGNKTKTDQNVEDFKSLSERERIWLKEMFMGPWDREERKKYPLIDPKTCKYFKKSIFTPRCMENCFREIISNACDNVIKSRKCGLSPDGRFFDSNFDPKRIEVTINGNLITIKNYGAPLVLAPHPEVSDSNGSYYGTVPELIFLKPGSGSNLDANYARTTSGTNGIGSKGTIIHSIYTRIRAGDNIRGCYMDLEVMHNGMEIVNKYYYPGYYFSNGSWFLAGEPYRGENFTEFTYELDFRKYDIDSYTEDEYLLFFKHSFEMCAMAKVPLVFNNVEYDYRNMTKFASCLDYNAAQSKIRFIKLARSDIKISKEECEKYVDDGLLDIESDCTILYTPNNGTTLSYVNFLFTERGGVHATAANNAVLELIHTILKTSNKLKLSDEDREKVDTTFIKNHLTIILNYKCSNPIFSDQTKASLKTPKPKIFFSQNDLKNVDSWKIFDKIQEMINQKNRSDRKKGKIFNIKFRDANNVGKPGKKKVLIAVEGGSAGGYGELFIRYLPGAFDIYAVYPEKGKTKNVSGLSISQMDTPEKSGQDNEIVRFIDTMGLEDEVDYTIHENCKNLRYDELWLMYDADKDGGHITSLKINLLYLRFPSFIKAGRLKMCHLPVIRAVKKNGDTIERFFSEEQYHIWKNNNPNVVHRADYFKGLASSTEEQAKEDTLFAPVTVIYFDNEAEFYLNLVFNKKGDSADERKKWMLYYKDYINRSIINQEGFVTITNILCIRMTGYSLYTLRRALMSNCDGIKDSQRKLIAYLIEEFLFKQGEIKPKKINQISNGAADRYCYHHGDTGFADTLVRLCQTFPGSNNLEYAKGYGVVGTRESNGDNAGAGRYVSAGLVWWFEHLIKKDLYDLVPKVISDEGDKCEPIFIPFLLPMGLANGAEGVAVGWSCKSPAYHIGDLCTFIIHFLKGYQVFPLIPWYRYFTGDIYLEYRTSSKRKKDSYQNFVSNPDIMEYGKTTMCSRGIFNVYNIRTKTIVEEIDDPEQIGKKIKVQKTINICDLEILEVPIGVVPLKLFLHLSALCDEPLNLSTENSNNIRYVFVGYRGSLEAKEIGMINKEGISNISTVDKNGLPVTYNNIYGYIKAYCDNMSDLFFLSKETRLKNLKEECIELAMKVSLILCSINGKIKFINRDDDQLRLEIENVRIDVSYIEHQEILNRLLNSKIPYSIFESLHAKEYTAKNKDKLIAKLKKCEKEIFELEQTWHLQRWVDILENFRSKINSMPEYKKLDKHIDKDYFQCNFEELIEEKIISKNIILH